MTSWVRVPDAEPFSGVGKIVVVYLTVNQGARVRFPPSPQNKNVSVAQSGRAAASKAEGCGFDSYSVRQY
jgi:hypothetical protein